MRIVKYTILFIFILLSAMIFHRVCNRNTNNENCLNENSSVSNHTKSLTDFSKFTSSKNEDSVRISGKSSMNLYPRVPNKIIQYGVGGTATTLQFQIICVLMAILHESEINSVGCFFGKKAFYKYTVIKTHSVGYKTLKLLPLDSWVFMTSSNSLSAEKQLKFENDKRAFQTMKLKCPYTADIETVSKRGHFIVYEYQSIFGVSDEQIQMAVEYLRYWDILRLCCGKQMSADWRNQLSPRKNYIVHHDQHSSTYPACEMYNISAVEHLLMKTYVFQRFSYVPSLNNVIGKPSNVDGDIDGHYCERCNRNITLNHLSFNDNCL